MHSSSTFLSLPPRKSTQTKGLKKFVSVWTSLTHTFYTHWPREHPTVPLCGVSISERVMDLATRLNQGRMRTRRRLVDWYSVWICGWTNSSSLQEKSKQSHQSFYLPGLPALSSFWVQKLQVWKLPKKISKLKKWYSEGNFLSSRKESYKQQLERQCEEPGNK